MATWEDGPEYAPLERPDEFRVPDASPLSTAAPYEQPAALAPKDRPQFADPPVPLRPLATLVPPVEEGRDPSLPFEVLTSTVTASESAWGAAHWSQPSQAGAGPAASGPWGPPGGSPWSPTSPILSTSGPAPVAGGFPSAGTPQWFAPAPYRPQPAWTYPVTARDVIRALTPGLIIVLAIGGLIYVIAPVTFVVAWGLSSRVQVARTNVRRTFGVAFGALVLMAVIVGLAGPLGFSDWWGGVAWSALLISWATLIVTPILVVRALRNGERPAPPTNTWA